MLKTLAYGLLIYSIIAPVYVFAYDNKFSQCDCDVEGFWSVSSILECQKVSDFLIAIAYFSIPIELLYFISFSDVPFKWVLVQFIAFIVLCGMTHLLNGWTYYGPHSFQLMLSLTVFKFLTALVSCATAITLLTLIPLLLQIKVRELFLEQNVLELDQEVGMMKKKKETSWHVRMLTQEIRKSLDKHTILHTTLVELSETLGLQNCAVWMPNESDMEMNLTHELKGRRFSENSHLPIRVSDPEVLEIIESKGVKLLRSDSILGATSNDVFVASIRMPMLRVSNFKGGTPILTQTCYAILVLVHSKPWSHQELEIVEVVADQVAVALSHAAVLEESQIMRETLVEQNRVLQEAKENAMMASQAWNSCQKVMSQGMRRPMHSILGLLSMLQDENLSSEKRIIIDTVVKTSSVVSTLINDVMEISAKDEGKFPLQMQAFQLHSTIKEASCLAKCLCVYKGFGFTVDIENTLPSRVIGDERRTFQVILHMVSHLLNVNGEIHSVTLRVSSESGSGGRSAKMWGMWRPSSGEECAYVKFEIETNNGDSQLIGSLSTVQFADKKQSSYEIKEGLNFSMCKKLVQMMQGYIWISRNSQGLAQSMTLVLKFHLPSLIPPIFELGSSSEQPNSNSLFRGLRIILADDDGVNRAVTKMLLEKLGCFVTSVASGFECLSALAPATSPFKILLLDLQMPEMDGFEVATRIRKSRTRNSLLIIALTASAEEYVSERCLQIGMNGIIRKPVLLRGIADELRKILLRNTDVA